MADTDRTLPDVIDATVLPPDEVERRRLRDVEVFGNAFVFTGLHGRMGVVGERIGLDLTERHDRAGVVIVTGRLPENAAEHLLALVKRFGIDRPLSVSVDMGTVERTKKAFADFRKSVSRLRGVGLDRIILDDLEQERLDAQLERDAGAHALIDGCRDAFGLKVLDVDDPADAAEIRRSRAAAARVERRTAGPWHDPTPWKHRKKGGRR